jgi:hypothetical protein
LQTCAAASSHGVAQANRGNFVDVGLSFDIAVIKASVIRLNYRRASLLTLSLESAR